MSKLMTLNELAIKYDADKKMSHHSFTQYYEKHFESLRDKEINLLEIGVKKGNSMRMWVDYFSKGIIDGIDIKGYCKQYEGGRIKITIGDQSNKEFLIQFAEQRGLFDIIIDDGSHRWKDQIETFEMLFPYIKEKGIYVIEDLHTSFVDKGEGKGENIFNVGDETCMEYLFNLACQLTKSRNKKNPQVMFSEIHFYKAICFIIKN